jgi:hypothetical protein
MKTTASDIEMAINFLLQARIIESSLTSKSPESPELRLDPMPQSTTPQQTRQDR